MTRATTKTCKWEENDKKKCNDDDNKDEGFVNPI